MEKRITMSEVSAGVDSADKYKDENPYLESKAEKKKEGKP